MSFGCKIRGFSLIELTIVLLVSGLLVSGMVAGFTRFVAQARVKQVQADLRTIEDALYGYVINNGNFPCPDMTAFPPVVGVMPPPTGSESRDATGSCQTGIPGNNEIGFLPAADLGVPAQDPWGMRYFYAVDSTYADLAVDVTFAIGDSATFEIYNGSTGTPVLLANNIVVVIFSTGPNLSIAPAVAEAEEVENVTADKRFVSRDYSPPGSTAPFDDIVRWISTSVLVHKMVDAEQLP